MTVKVDGHDVADKLVGQAVDITVQLHEGHKQVANKLLQELKLSEREDAFKIVNAVTAGMRVHPDKARDASYPDAEVHRDESGQIMSIDLAPTNWDLLNAKFDRLKKFINQ